MCLDGHVVGCRACIPGTSTVFSRPAVLARKDGDLIGIARVEVLAALGVVQAHQMVGSGAVPGQALVVPGLALPEQHFPLVGVRGPQMQARGPLVQAPHGLATRGRGSEADTLPLPALFGGDLRGLVNVARVEVLTVGGVEQAVHVHLVRDASGSLCLGRNGSRSCLGSLLCLFVLGRGRSSCLLCGLGAGVATFLRLCGGRIRCCLCRLCRGVATRSGGIFGLGRGGVRTCLGAGGRGRGHIRVRSLCRRHDRGGIRLLRDRSCLGSLLLGRDVLCGGGHLRNGSNDLVACDGGILCQRDHRSRANRNRQGGGNAKARNACAQGL